ncbi:MAG: hypothetical protein EAY75_14665 [Bacteroidetes bacterium]|nr:MAG: hypothetical protein EAY75_14665 [Bacteroidota bacterium]
MAILLEFILKLNVLYCKRYLSFCLLFGFCVFHFFAGAQAPLCRIRHLNIENGLPQSSVKGMAFDKNGFLWLETNSGLQKFDGRHVQIVFEDSLQAMIARVENTYDDWIIAYDIDLNVFHLNQGQARYYKSMKPEFFHRLRGKALFGQKYNLVKNDLSIGRTAYKSLEVCWSFDRQISFYTAYDSTGIYIADTVLQLPGIRFQKSGFINNSFIFSSKHNRQITALHKNGTFQQITRLRLADVVLNVDDFVDRSYWVRGKGALFAIYNHTFYSLTLDGNTILLKPVYEKLPHLNKIDCAIYNEATSVLAIGEYKSGLFFIERGIARVLLTKDYAPEIFRNRANDNIASLLWTTKGEFLAGNGFMYNKSKTPWYDVDSIVPFFLMQDSYSRIWLQSRNGMPVILNSDFSVFARLNKAWDYYGALEMGTGVYWTHKDSTISKLEWDNHRFDRTFSNNLNINGTIVHMYKLDNTHILLCCTRGLYRYNVQNGRLDHITDSKEYNFRGMTISPGGNIYVNTYGDGYFLLRGDSLLPLPLDKDKHLKFPHGFVFDKLGYVWIPTNFGLFQALEQDIIDYANNQAENVYFHYYDQNYGFATNEFNGGGYPSALLAPDGKMYFASMNGLAIVDPESIKPVLPEGPIFVKEVLVNGKRVNYANKINLPRDFNNATLRVELPYFGSDKNLYLSYRINGLNAQWMTLPDNGEVNISSLKGGEYTIEFRKMNGFGKNNYAYLRLPLKVQKYFYETTVFYVFSAILFVLAALGFAKFRNRVLLKREAQLESEIRKQTKTLSENLENLSHKNVELKEKTEMLNTIYAVVTHDLISPIRFLRRALFKLDEMPKADMKQQMDMILHTTEHAEEFVHDLLVWIKLNHDAVLAEMDEISPHELIEKNIQLFLWLANDRGVELSQDPPYINTPVKVSEELVSILLRNFIDNALKYTSKGRVSIKSHVEADVLNISIKDTGKGMMPDIVEKINARNAPYVLTLKSHMGMKIVFDILGILKGELKIESELNKGTIVHLKIPVNVN